MLIPSVLEFETFPPKHFFWVAGLRNPQTTAGQPETKEPWDPRPLMSQAFDGYPGPSTAFFPSPLALPIKIYAPPHTNALGKICDEETRRIVHKYSQPYANNLKFIFLFFKEEKKIHPFHDHFQIHWGWYYIRPNIVFSS